MKSINKITALVMAATLALGNVAYAADGYLEPYEYMEDIYKFDVGTFAEQAKEATSEKKGKYYRESDIISAFGFMEKDAGGDFRENDNLTNKELAIAMLRVNSGSDSSMENRYNEMEEITVPMSEALSYVTATLGYDTLAELQSVELQQVAAKYKILDGMGYIAEKYITRGEFAKLLYNILELPMFINDLNTVGGSFDNEDTLLERHGVIKIKGFMNGYRGVNVYTPRLVDKNSVYIDGVEYDVADAYNNADLGDNVLAYVVKEDNKAVYIENINKKKPIVIKLTDIINASASNISYTLEEGSVKRIGLSSLDYIVYNGVRQTDLTFISSLTAEDGTVKICSTEQSGRYNCVIVNKYDNYVTRATDAYEQIIYLRYNAEFEGLNYISVSDTEKILCTLDGEDWNPLELGNNVAISVAKNSVNGFMTIIASSNRENTAISELNDGAIYLGAKKYYPSPMYEAAISRGDADALVVGKNAVFYVTESGFIAGHTDSSEEKFGYLRRISWKDDIQTTYEISVFTQDAQWVTIPLKDKITLDGDVQVEGQEVYKRIKEANAEKNFIRYRQNGKGLITFLDTIDNTSFEVNDDERILFKSNYSGKTNWTAGFSMPNTEYRMDEDTYVFAIPRNDEYLEKYNVLKGCVLPVDSIVELSYYSPDKYNVVSLVKYTGSLSSGTSVATQDVYIDRVTPVWNDELGEDVYKIKAYIFKSLGAKGRGTMEEQEYTMSETDFQDNSTLSKGDMCTLHFYSDGTISKVETHVQNAVMPAPYDDSDNYTEIGCGTLELIDADTKMIVVNVNGTKRSFCMRAIGIFDTYNQEFRNASAGELRIGDKIFYKGVVGHSIANYIVR